MTTVQFISFCLRFLAIFKSKSPIDTGNLRYNGIRFEIVDDATITIYIDDVIAPYVYYTNEPWLSPRWKGKANPNEGWIEKAIEETLEQIANEYKGVVSEG